MKQSNDRSLEKCVLLSLEVYILGLWNPLFSFLFHYDFLFLSKFFLEFDLGNEWKCILGNTNNNNNCVVVHSKCCESVITLYLLCFSLFRISYICCCYFWKFKYKILISLCHIVLFCKPLLNTLYVLNLNWK